MPERFNWFVYHARRYTSALFFKYMNRLLNIMITDYSMFTAALCRYAV